MSAIAIAGTNTILRTVDRLPDMHSAFPSSPTSSLGASVVADPALSFRSWKLSKLQSN